MLCTLRVGFVRSRRYFCAAPVGKYKFKDVKKRPEIYVKSGNELQELVATIKAAKVIGIDTEFIDYPYYRPRLEVLQVSTPNVMAAIDCQRLRPQLGPLMEVIVKKEVILHSCFSDFQILADLTKQLASPRRLPKKVFDTQVAAAYLGYGNMVGFKPLLAEVFGIEMDKSDTLSDWSMRPLTKEQIAYAISDVRYLHALREKLTKELKACGRYEWFLADMEAFSNHVFFTPPAPEEAWRSIMGARKASSGSEQLSVIKELARWRETTALVKDMNPISILRNESLGGIASMLPTEAAQLTQIQGVRPRLVREIGKHIMSAVKTGSEKPEAERPWHHVSHQEGGRVRQGLFNLFNSRISTIAERLRMSPFVLAPRHELFDLSSVSMGALRRVMLVPEKDFKPTKTMSNLKQVRFDLLPAEYNTRPTALYGKRELVPGQDGNLLIRDEMTEDSEVEMLLKSKLLCGWRRAVVGNDLLKIAMGEPVSWARSQVQGEFDQKADPKVDASVAGWAAKMEPQERLHVLRLAATVTKHLKQAGEEVAAPPAAADGCDIMDMQKALQQLSVLKTDKA